MSKSRNVIDARLASTDNLYKIQQNSRQLRNKYNEFKDPTRLSKTAQLPSTNSRRSYGDSSYEEENDPYLMNDHRYDSNKPSYDYDNYPPKDDIADNRVVDPKYKGSAMTRKISNRSKLPGAGKSSNQDRHGFKELYSDGYSEIVGNSEQADRFPAWGMVDRTLPFRPSNDTNKIIFAEDLGVNDRQDERELRRQEKKFARQAKESVAGKKSDPNRDAVGDLIGDKHHDSGISVSRQDYPQWDQLPGPQAVKDIYHKSSNILSNTYDRDMEDASNHIESYDRLDRDRGITNRSASNIHTDYNDDEDYTEEQLRASERIGLPVAGKPSNRSELWKVTNNNADSRSQISEYREKYIEWSPDNTQRKRSIDATMISDVSQALGDGHDDSKAWESEHHSKFRDTGLLNINPVMPQRDALRDYISFDDELNFQDTKSEYKDKYVPWDNERENKVLPSNAPISTIDLSHDNYQNMYKKPVEILKDVSKIAGKPSQPRQEVFEVPEDLMSTKSEYKDKYPGWDVISHPLNVSRGVHPGPSMMDHILDHSDDNKWQSEHREKFVHFESSPTVNTIRKAADHNLFPHEAEKMESTSEYREKFVHHDSPDRSLVVKPKTETHINLMDVNDDSQPWESEYKSKYYPVSDDGNPRVAGKPSIVSHGVYDDALKFGPVTSEYKERFPPHDSHHYNEALVKIDHYQHDDVILGDGIPDKPWKSEHRDKYVPLTSDQDAHIEAMANKQRVIDHVNLSDMDKPSKPAVSEYAEKFQSFPIVDLSNLTDVANKVQKDTINLKYLTRDAWKSEYDERFLGKPAINDMNVAGRRSQANNDMSNIFKTDQTMPSASQSEYKDKYTVPVVADVGHDDFRNRSVGDSIQLSFNDDSVKWQSEHKDQYGDKSVDAASREPIAGKKSRSHGYLPPNFSFSKSVEGSNMTEYKSKFIPHELSKTANFRDKFVSAASVSVGAKDDSCISSKWQSEYDARCMELRQKMDELKTSLTAINAPAGKGYDKRISRPTNFAWQSRDDKNSNELEEDATRKSVTGISEYKDQYLYPKIDKENKIVLPRHSGLELLLGKSIDSSTPWITEYDDKYFDYAKIPRNSKRVDRKRNERRDIEQTIDSLANAVDSNDMKGIANIYETKGAELHDTSYEHSDISSIDTGYLARMPSNSANQSGLEQITTKSFEGLTPKNEVRQNVEGTRSIGKSLAADSPAVVISTPSTSKESPSLLLNTAPASGPVSTRLLKDYALSKKLRNPLLVTETHSQYRWPKQPTASIGKSREYKLLSNMIKDEDVAGKNRATLPREAPKVNDSTNISTSNQAAPPNDSREKKENIDNKWTVTPAGRSSIDFGRKPFSERLQMQKRSYSAPSRRASMPQGSTNMNILLYNPRYPQEPGFDRWKSESRASFTWKPNTI